MTYTASSGTLNPTQLQLTIKGRKKLPIIERGNGRFYAANNVWVWGLNVARLPTILGRQGVNSVASD